MKDFLISILLFPLIILDLIISKLSNGKHEIFNYNNITLGEYDK